MTGEPGDWGPRRDRLGRFIPGQGGRPVGSRNRASARVTRMILRDFEDNGEALLPKLRRWFVPQYLQLVGRLLPRDTEEPDLDAMSDKEAARAARELREMLAVLEARVATATDEVVDATAAAEARIAELLGRGR